MNNCYSYFGYQNEDIFFKNMLKISKHGPVGSCVKALSFTTAVGFTLRSHNRYAQGQTFAKNNYK